MSPFLFLLALLCPLASQAGRSGKLMQLTQTHKIRSISAVSYLDSTTVTYEDLTLTNTEYTATVNLGGSSTDFQMVLDTTTADSWVFSSDCQTCVTAKDKTKAFTCSSPCEYLANYKEDVSNLTVNGLVSSLNFNISVYTATDTYTISSLSVTTVPLYIAIDTTGSQSFTAQGGLGLANSDTNILHYYYKQGKIPDKVFAFYFSDQYSLFSFGYEEPYFGLEDYTEFNVVSGDLAWGIPLGSVYVNNKSNSSFISSTQRVQFDTTLSTFAVPSAVHELWAAEIASALEGNNCGITTQGLVTCECSSSSDLEKLPTISLTLSQSTRLFTLETSNYATYANGNCTVEIYKDDSLVTWVLGLAFLKSYYVVFDQDDQLVKIATLNTEEAESYLQEDSTRVTIIVVGIVIAVLSIILLLFIFKNVPVDLTRNMEKGD